MKPRFFFAALIVLSLASAPAQTRPDPYERLPALPSFTLTSQDAVDGSAFAPAQMSGAFGVPGGRDQSPQLSWTGEPEGTRSFVVTMFDPDAPTPSGFWHWAVVDLPASSNYLPTGAGSPDGRLLPKGAWQLPNDARMAQYVGAAPPKGDGRHRYYIAVNALDVDKLPVPRDSTPALLSFSMLGHTLARAVIVPWAEQ